MRTIVLCVGIVCLATFGCASEPKPRAVLLETEYQFPPAVEGIVITHDFLLRNEGTSDLVIRKLESG
ncbi:MAG TPA: hypothetical protein ENN34_13970 [Deltaproteobacteria bacterium]|nr:hypothetical protein [Deltaproteobacteria bacterium]